MPPSSSISRRSSPAFTRLRCVQREIALYMGDGDRLRVLAAGIAGGGVAHMTDGHRAGHVVQDVLIEHGADQTGVLMAVDHAVFVYGDTGSS